MEGEREMPQGDDDPAPEYAAVVSQPSIRDETTENRREPHAPRVRAVDRTGVFVVESERVDHVKNEKGPHAVVGEALPRLGEEERYQPSRVAEDVAVVGHTNRSFCDAVAGAVLGRSSVPRRSSHFSTSKWCSCSSARRSTGENSWNASSCSTIDARSASSWKLSSVAPRSASIASSVREATIGCARSSTNTSVRRPGPRSSSIGTSPTMRSERQYFP